MRNKKEMVRQIHLQMLTHDLKCLKCREPDKMYQVAMAERTRYALLRMELLWFVMAADGKEETEIKDVFNDGALLEEAFVKYKIPDEQPELTAEEKDENQVRCIRNVMNDFSVTSEQAMVLLDINKDEWSRYIKLLNSRRETLAFPRALRHLK